MMRHKKETPVEGASSLSHLVHVAGRPPGGVRGGIQKPRVTVVLYEENLSSWCQGGDGSCKEGGCRPRPALLPAKAHRAAPRLWVYKEKKVAFVDKPRI